MSSCSSSGSNGSRFFTREKFKQLSLYDIDNEWKTNSSIIISVQLLTRGLGGINRGAVHTALLFETNESFLVIEYGENGLKVRNYLKKVTQKMSAYESIMGKHNFVNVYEITQCFENELNEKLTLKLNDIYMRLDELKHIYTVSTYSYIDRNCRHFAREICQKLGCNRKGLEFLSSFLLNLPKAAKSLLNVITFGVISLNENLSLQESFFVGFWILNERKYLAREECPYL